MNNQPNGNRPGHAPLHMSAPQRAALLQKMGISAGWLLMSVSEMFDLKKAMEGATKENERLNKQTARLVARGLVHTAIAEKALSSARATLALLAEMGGTFAHRADALREVANIDEALTVLPTLPKTEDETEKKEGPPNG